MRKARKAPPTAAKAARPSLTERQELWCHGCGRYVQFTLDMSLNGNHVLNCPNCGHEHCRVVRDGRITDIRWDSRNQTFYVQQATTSTNSTFTMSSTASTFLYCSWMNVSAAVNS